MDGPSWQLHASLAHLHRFFQKNRAGLLVANASPVKCCSAALIESEEGNFGVVDEDFDAFQIARTGRLDKGGETAGVGPLGVGS